MKKLSIIIILCIMRTILSQYGCSYNERTSCYIGGSHFNQLPELNFNSLKMSCDASSFNYFFGVIMFDNNLYDYVPYFSWQNVIITKYGGTPLSRDYFQPHLSISISYVLSTSCVNSNSSFRQIDDLYYYSSDYGYWQRQWFNKSSVVCFQLSMWLGPCDPTFDISTDLKIIATKRECDIASDCGDTVIGCLIDNFHYVCQANLCIKISDPMITCGSNLPPNCLNSGFQNVCQNNKCVQVTIPPTRCPKDINSTCSSSGVNYVCSDGSCVQQFVTNLACPQNVPSSCSYTGLNYNCVNGSCLSNTIQMTTCPHDTEPLCLSPGINNVCDDGVCKEIIVPSKRCNNCSSDEECGVNKLTSCNISGISYKCVSNQCHTENTPATCSQTITNNADILSNTYITLISVAGSILVSICGVIIVYLKNRYFKIKDGSKSSNDISVKIKEDIKDKVVHSSSVELASVVR